MSRVRLVINAGLINSNDPVQHTDLAIAVCSLADTPFDFQFKGFLKFLFVPGELGSGGQRGEVVAVYDDPDVALWVVEAARGCYPAPEAHVDELLRIAILPELPSITGAVHTPF